jgi:hypothetical protein
MIYIGSHTRENMATVAFETLQELNIAQKLVAVVADNASNNDTLTASLHKKLLESYNDRLDPVFNVQLKPMMRFRGLEHQVRCLAHVINRIVVDILKILKTGSLKQANEALNTNQFVISSPIAKLRIIVIWIGRSLQRLQQ